MNEEQLLRRLGARSKQEGPPQVDVSARVMAAIDAERYAKAASSAALVWLAATSGALAVCVATLAFQALQLCADPLTTALFDWTWGIL